MTCDDDSTAELTNRLKRYGTIRPFDDGHIPAPFRGNHETPSQPSSYLRYCSPSSSTTTMFPNFSPSFVDVYDRALPVNLTRAIYRTTVGATFTDETEHHNHHNGNNDDSSGNRGGGPRSVLPWGTYVTFREAREYLDQIQSSSQHRKQRGKRREGSNDTSTDSDSIGSKSSSTQNDDDNETFGYETKSSSTTPVTHHDRIVQQETHRHRLAVAAVAHFLLDQTECSSPPSRYHYPSSSSSSPSSPSSSMENPMVDALRTLFESTPPNDTDSDTETSSEPAKPLSLHPHGVGVWALPSSPSTHVPYHVDYAEYLRYRHNIVVYPLLAGTVHCTEGIVRGGDFAVQLMPDEKEEDEEGEDLGEQEEEETVVNAYLKQGYKGCRTRNIHGGWVRPKTQQQNGDVTVNENTGWTTVPYRFNRGILHSGRLPHLSGTVEECGDLLFGVEDGSEREDSSTPKPTTLRRVIMGLNVFGTDIGKYVRAVPEHSRSFRCAVREFTATSAAASASQCRIVPNGTEQTANTTTTTNCSDNRDISGRKGGLTLAAIKGNARLRRALVVAKREKVKDEWRKLRFEMTEWVFAQLRTMEGLADTDVNSDNNDEDQLVSFDPGKGKRTVGLGQLIQEWVTTKEEDACSSVHRGGNQTIVPSFDDMHVHLDYLVRRKYVHDESFRIGVYGCGDGGGVDENGRLRLETEIGLIPTTKQPVKGLAIGQ